jgi:predicted transcriptional regulator
MPDKQEAPVLLQLRLPPDLKARVEVMAKARRRSQNAETILALEERCREYEEAALAEVPAA